MNKDEQLARLLRLKRHEKPGEDYFEGFLDEFHAYQRKALATQSAASLWWERVGTALSALRRPATAWTALGAYAAIMLLINAWPAPDHSAKTTFVISGQPSDVPALPQAPPQTWQTAIPVGQTIQVSDTPGLTPPASGKRRTPDQPRDPRNAVGPGEIREPLPLK